MLNILQVIVSIIIIILVLLQERSSGLSGVFGGGGGTPYQARRGMDKFLFWGTAGAGAVFVGLALVDLLIF